MKNPLHLIISSHDLAKNIKTFKSFTARQYIDGYQEHHKSWILKQLHDNRNAYKRDQKHWVKFRYPNG